MKKLLAILFLLPSLLSAQPSDSIEISTQGAKARIARPAQGQQTTVRLKDSLSQLDIRISNNVPATTGLADSGDKKKSIKYFSEISMGTLMAEIPATSAYPKYLYGTEYFSFTVKNIRPGFEAALSLRKGTYRIANRLFFQSGINYRFMTFSADAEYSSYRYDLTMMQQDTSKPIVPQDYYKEDTVEVGMRKFVNQVSVPVMLQYRINDKLAFSFGIAFDLSFTGTRLDHRGLDGELYKEIQFSNPDYPRLQLRPQFSLGIGPLGLYISKDVAGSSFGYGNAERKSTRFTHIGISYKFF